MTKCSKCNATMFSIPQCPTPGCSTNHLYSTEEEYEYKGSSPEGLNLLEQDIAQMKRLFEEAMKDGLPESSEELQKEYDRRFKDFKLIELEDGTETDIGDLADQAASDWEQLLENETPKKAVYTVALTAARMAYEYGRREGLKEAANLVGGEACAGRCDCYACGMLNRMVEDILDQCSK